MRKSDKFLGKFLSCRISHPWIEPRRDDGHIKPGAKTYDLLHLPNQQADSLKKEVGGERAFGLLQGNLKQSTVVSSLTCTELITFNRVLYKGLPNYAPRQLKSWDSC